MNRLMMSAIARQLDGIRSGMANLFMSKVINNLVSKMELLTRQYENEDEQLGGVCLG